MTIPVSEFTVCTKTQVGFYKQAEGRGLDDRIMWSCRLAAQFAGFSFLIEQERKNGKVAKAWSILQTHVGTREIMM